jgi:hypothetical protein
MELSKLLMSAFGTKQTWRSRSAMSAFGSRADIAEQPRSFTPTFLKLDTGHFLPIAQQQGTRFAGPFCPCCLSGVTLAAAIANARQTLGAMRHHAASGCLFGFRGSIVF